MHREFEPVDNGASSSIAYDMYVFNGGHHVHDGMPLDEYRNRFPMVIELNGASVKKGYLLLPGEIDPLVIYELASPQCRLIMKSMLKLLEINDLDGVYFTPFDHNNVVVTSFGKIRLRDVTIASDLSGAALPEAQRTNYLSALEIFQSLFIGAEVPDDVQDLFDIIQDEDQYNLHRPMFHVHCAVLQILDYSDVYRDLHEHIRLVIDKPEMRNILLNLPYVDD